MTVNKSTSYKQGENEVVPNKDKERYYNLKQLTQILLDRLEKKGIKPSIIPSFIRTLANVILADPNMSFLQVNNQLHLLGWDDFELDYCTLELAKTCFEADGLKGFENDRILLAVRDSNSLSPK